MGRASILVPSPNVAENHQYFNALELEKAGAAVVIEEKDLTGETLIDTVRKLISRARQAAGDGQAGQNAGPAGQPGQDHRGAAQALPVSAAGHLTDTGKGETAHGPG